MKASLLPCIVQETIAFLLYLYVFVFYAPANGGQAYSVYAVRVCICVFADVYVLPKLCQVHKFVIPCGRIVYHHQMMYQALDPGP